MQREIVYVDTFGSGFDTQVGITSACGTAPTCNDDSCATTQSQTVATLNAGTHYVVVDTNGATGGAIALHLQHIPVSGNAVGTLPAGMSTALTGNTATSVGNSPGSCNFANDLWYYWLTCPAGAMGVLNAQTCGSPYNSSLGLRNGTGGGGGCQSGGCPASSDDALLNSNVSAGAGIHVLTVDGDMGSTGMYTLNVNRP